MFERAAFGNGVAVASLAWNVPPLIATSLDPLTRLLQGRCGERPWCIQSASSRLNDVQKTLGSILARGLEGEGWWGLAMLGYNRAFLRAT